MESNTHKEQQNTSECNIATLSIFHWIIEFYIKLTQAFFTLQLDGLPRYGMIII